VNNAFGQGRAFQRAFAVQASCWLAEKSINLLNIFILVVIGCFVPDLLVINPIKRGPEELLDKKVVQLAISAYPERT
jgi:hypothetical protein